MVIDWIERLEPEVRERLNWIRTQRMTDLDKTRKECLYLIEYAKAHHNLAISGCAHYYLAELHFMNLDYEKAITECEKAYFELQNGDAPRMLANTCNILGVIHTQCRNLETAMDYYLRGISVCKKNDFYFTSGMLHSNIAEIYMQLQDYESAKNSLLKAWEEYHMEEEALDFYYHCLAQNRINLIIILITIGCLDDAEKLIPQARELMSKTHHDFGEVLNFSLAQAYLALIVKDYESFEKLLPEICSNFDSCMDRTEYTESICFLLKACYDTGKINAFVSLKPIITTLLDSDCSAASKVHILKLCWKVCSDKTSVEAITCTALLLDALEKEQEYSIRTKAASIRNLIQRNHLYSDTQKWMLRANKDPLTNIWNRRYFEKLFEKECASNFSRKQPLYIGIIDIDYFKEYNDHYGHTMGDQCLCRIASIFLKYASEYVQFARFGGDEFVLIATEIDKSAVCSMMNKIIDDIHNAAIPHAHSPAKKIVTISAGINYHIPQNNEKLTNFIQKADQMLYTVKDNGRDGYLITN